MHRYLSSLTTTPSHRAFFAKRKEQRFIGQLCAGQPQAWLQLLDRWSPRLYSYVVYNVGNENEARKLVHLILSDVIHTLIDAPKVPNLTILIFSIAYRRTLRYRQQNLPPRLPRRSEDTQVDERDDQKKTEQEAYFIQRLHRFSLEAQQLLLLRYVCGVTLTELSQIIGQPKEVLAQTLYRAKLYLQ